MSDIKPIRSREDHTAALHRIELLMDAEPGTPEAQELDLLADLVEHYETKHFPIPKPTAVEAIQFRMEQGGLTARDLIPIFGSRSKVSEVLAGKRQITLSSARALHEHFGIPAAVLLQPPTSLEQKPLGDAHYKRFPLKDMAKQGWVRDMPRIADHATGLMQDLIRRAGVSHASAATLFRKNDHSRTNAKTDSRALQAWCWQVLAIANSQLPRNAYRPGTVTPGFLRELVQLSWSDDGPKLAKELLTHHGIPLVVLTHLPRTHLDGAALRLADGRPVVALTLRYDRIDSFWFSLVHELAHVGLHLDCGKAEWFVDDLSLRGAGQRQQTSRKRRPMHGRRRRCSPVRSGRSASLEAIQLPSRWWSWPGSCEFTRRLLRGAFALNVGTTSCYRISWEWEKSGGTSPHFPFDAPCAMRHAITSARRARFQPGQHTH